MTKKLDKIVKHIQKWQSINKLLRKTVNIFEGIFMNQITWRILAVYTAPVSKIEIYPNSPITRKLLPLIGQLLEFSLQSKVCWVKDIKDAFISQRNPKGCVKASSGIKYLQPSSGLSTVTLESTTYNNLRTSVNTKLNHTKSIDKSYLPKEKD